MFWKHGQSMLLSLLLLHNLAVRSVVSLLQTTSGRTVTKTSNHKVARSNNLWFLYSTTKSVKEASNSNKQWFPTKIQDTINYDDIVIGLYLRHVITETLEMADLAIQHYLTTCRNTETVFLDPFGETALLFSACDATRNDGGTIGWVEREQVHGSHPYLSTHVIEQLYKKQPKAGDLCTIQCTRTGQYHVIQVAEVWTKLVLQTATTQTAMVLQQCPEVGAFTGTNNVLGSRKKLKGAGVSPTIPTKLSTYSIQTAGCQMNVADSERLAGILQNDLSMTPATETEQQKADLIIFNTCSIRDHAEQKLYNALGPYCARKRKGEKFVLMVAGCVAQQEGQALLRRVPELDVVLGPQYIPFLGNILQNIAETQQQVVVTAPMLLQQEQQDNFHTKPVRGHDVRAWVNVIHGCNEHCTYCVVPATRGMEQSRTMEAILHECLELADAGYKEVTLLGQNIDAYGRDMVPKRTFADLLEFLNARVPDQMRIRYVTSHPRYFSDRVIDAVANLDKVCECFHMPFQAGDDEVLKRMRRGYTFDSYMKIIEKIRQQAPDAAICADVIVGFPGETEEAFQRTLDLMERVEFDNINSFAYSPRPNTEAALWDDQVPDEIKADRLQRVQQLAAKHGLRRSERYLGKTVEVLVEDSNPRNPSQVMGRTRQGRQVYFDGVLTSLKGRFLKVKITEARTWSLMGVLQGNR